MSEWVNALQASLTRPAGWRRGCKCSLSCASRSHPGQLSPTARHAVLAMVMPSTPTRPPSVETSQGQRRAAKTEHRSTSVKCRTPPSRRAVVHWVLPGPALLCPRKAPVCPPAGSSASLRRARGRWSMRTRTQLGLSSLLPRLSASLARLHCDGPSILQAHQVVHPGQPTQHLRGPSAATPEVAC